MYRVKDDKRILQSADLICKGLTECLKSKPISEVNVSAIAQASGVSRATFYRIFDTPCDVLNLICDKTAGDAIRSMEENAPKGKYAVLKFMIDFMMEHSDTLECLLKSGRPDMLHKSFSRLFDVALPSHVFTDLTPIETIYVKDSIASFMCSMLFVWIKKGKKESSDELISLFKKVRWHDPNKD